MMQLRRALLMMHAVNRGAASPSQPATTTAGQLSSSSSQQYADFIRASRSLERSFEAVFQLNAKVGESERDDRRTASLAAPLTLLALVPTAAKQRQLAQHCPSHDLPLSQSQRREISNVQRCLQVLLFSAMSVSPEIIARHSLPVFERYARFLFLRTDQTSSLRDADAHPQHSITSSSIRSGALLAVIDLLVSKKLTPSKSLFDALFLSQSSPRGGATAHASSSNQEQEQQGVIRFRLGKHHAFGASWLHAVTLLSWADGSLSSSNPQMNSKNNKSSSRSHISSSDIVWVAGTIVSRFGVREEESPLPPGGETEGKILFQKSGERMRKADDDASRIHPSLPRILRMLEASRDAELRNPKLVSDTPPQWRGPWRRVSIEGKRLVPIFPSKKHGDSNKYDRNNDSPAVASVDAEPNDTDETHGTELILAGSWAAALSHYVKRRDEQRHNSFRDRLRPCAQGSGKFYQSNQVTLLRQGGNKVIASMWRNDAREDIAFAATAAIASGSLDLVLKFREMFASTLFSHSTAYQSQGDFVVQMVTTMGNSLLPLSSLRPLLQALLHPPPVDAYPTTEQAAPDEAEGGKTSHLASLLKAHAQSLRNIHVSLWIEAIASVGTAKDALAALISTTNVPSSQAGGVVQNTVMNVVLGPECASAVLTSCVLYFASLGSSSSSSEADDDEAWEMLKRCEHLHFLVPHEKSHAQLHLKALYSPEFVTDEFFFDQNGEWDPTNRWLSNEVTLCGRASRLVWSMPITNEARRGAQHDLLEPCRVKLVRLNLVEAVKTILLKQWNRSGSIAKTPSQPISQDSELLQPLTTENVKTSDVVIVPSSPSSSSTDDHTRCGELGSASCQHPSLVYRNVSTGIAIVLKPAGMNVTLHATRPSLIPRLSVMHPWAGGSRGDVSVFSQHGLLNRIDSDTSGLVAVANNEQCLVESFSRSNSHKLFAKKYLALAIRIDPSDRARASDDIPFLLPRGYISGPVFASGSSFLRNIHHQQQQQDSRGAPETQLATSSSGNASISDLRQAVTEYTVLEHFAKQGIYLISVHLSSGRRHQIRQHFAQIFHPLLGDVRYHHRAGHPCIDRYALHAAEMEICVGSKKVVVDCEPPGDFARALSLLRQAENK